MREKHELHDVLFIYYYNFINMTIISDPNLKYTEFSIYRIERLKIKSSPDLIFKNWEGNTKRKEKRKGKNRKWRAMKKKSWNPNGFAFERWFNISQKKV